jgi:hypothetical protein
MKTKLVLNQIFEKDVRFEILTFTQQCRRYPMINCRRVNLCNPKRIQTTYQLVMLVFNIVPLIMELTRPVREGLSTDSLKFHPAPPCPSLLRPAGRPPNQTALQPFGGGPPGGLRPSSSPLDTPRRTGLHGTHPPPHLLSQELAREILISLSTSGEFHDQGDNVKNQYY